MRTEQDINTRIEELEAEVEELEEEFGEHLEDEGWEEDSSRAEKLQEELDWQKEIIEKQIKILNWALGKFK